MVVALVVAAMALGGCSGGSRLGGDGGLPPMGRGSAASLTDLDRDQSMRDLSRNGEAVRGEGRQLRNGMSN